MCEPTCYSPEPTVVGVWPAATELTVTNAYSYEAVDGAGQKRRGLETAMNSAAVHATLEARGLIVLALQEADATLPAAPAPGPPPGSGSRDVLEATRALAALLPAGLPLARALHAAAEVAGPDVGAALREVQARVERGGGRAGLDHPDAPRRERGPPAAPRGGPPGVAEGRRAAAGAGRSHHGGRGPAGNAGVEARSDGPTFHRSVVPTLRRSLTPPAPRPPDRHPRPGCPAPATARSARSPTRPASRGHSGSGTGSSHPAA